MSKLEKEVKGAAKKAAKGKGSGKKNKGGSPVGKAKKEVKKAL